MRHKRWATRLVESVRGHGVRIRYYWFPFWRKHFMVNMDFTQKILITVAPVDDPGNPANIDGPPTYPVDTAGIVTVLPSADGLSCEVRGITNITGTVTVTPTALANGKTITAPPIVINVSAPPKAFATRLIETVSDPMPQ